MAGSGLASCPPPAGGSLPPPWVSPGRVLRLAGALGSELQRLGARVGPAEVAGLVAQVVPLLELLEALAQAGGGGGGGGGRPEEERSGRQDSAQVGPPKATRAPPFSSSSPQEPRAPLLRSPSLAEEEDQLATSQAQAGNTLRKERELILRLKEVVDKQRDEIRAQAHEIGCRARDTEALQEQLNRFMSVNEELRRKLAVVRAQLKVALEQKGEAEKALIQAHQEAKQLQGPGAHPEPSTAGARQEEEAVGGISGQGPPSTRAQGRNAFSREDLWQILAERNELKTSLFLVQEELDYYQRELLNNERIPGILLEAVKATIKKQRKKIRAKMLGTAEETASSEEEEEEGMWLSPPLSTDCPDGPLPESRIKSFFSQRYCRSSKGSIPGSGPAGAWEIVEPQDVGPEEEERSPSCPSGPPPNGPDP